VETDVPHRPEATAPPADGGRAVGVATIPPPTEAAPVGPSVAGGPIAALRGLLGRPLTSYYLLLASAGLLLVIGLVMVFSATSVQAYASSGNAYASVSRQLIYAVIGLVAFWFAHRLPVRTYRAVSVPLMVIALGLLLIQDAVVGLADLRVLATTQAGPLRVDSLWLYLGPIQVQPSELGKLALALWGAGVLVRHGPNEKRFADLARTLFPMAALMLVLVGYNDLGTAICMMILFVGLIYAAGVQLRVFAWFGLIGLLGVLLLVMVQGYRVERLTGFWHPLTHCDVNQINNPCYQELEGRYAIAGGGWFGVGLGQGHLKWGRLPNAHNDFIFAVIAEELGIVGCFVVLALLSVLAYAGLRIARRVDDPFRRIVATGITAWLVGQATINIAGVIGLLPITGLPLPFISDGGSALVVVLGAVGVLASFARAEPDAARALHARPPDRWVRLIWAPLPPLPSERPARPAKTRLSKTRPSEMSPAKARRAKTPADAPEAAAGEPDRQDVPARRKSPFVPAAEPARPTARRATDRAGRSDPRSEPTGRGGQGTRGGKVADRAGDRSPYRGRRRSDAAGNSEGKH
jgi:cell division protein FtsW